MYFKKLSVLKLAIYLQLLFILGLMIFDYASLSSDEGWGMIALIALMLVSLFGLLIDYILYKFIKKEMTYNLVGIGFLVGYLIAFRPWAIF